MKRTAILLGLMLLLLLPASVATAQSGGPYDLPWFNVSGGGSRSTGGDYTLGGTIGQPDAGVMTGGNYTLGGGFWGSAAAQCRIYLPLVLRSV